MRLGDRDSQWCVVDDQAELIGQARRDGGTVDRETADLAEERQLEDCDWRCRQISCLQSPARPPAQEIGASGVKPDEDMRIEVDQGRHSADQST